MDDMYIIYVCVYIYDGAYHESIIVYLRKGLNFTCLDDIWCTFKSWKALEGVTNSLNRVAPGLWSGTFPQW
jgi:hypothetical protein